MAIKKIDKLPDDAVFLRLKNNNDAFVHFVNERYIVKTGMCGACIYLTNDAKLVIENNPDLEMINANELLKIRQN